MSCRSRTSLLYHASGSAITIMTATAPTISITTRGSTAGRIRDEGGRQKDEERNRPRSYLLCVLPYAYACASSGFFWLNRKVSSVNFPPPAHISSSARPK